MLFLTQRLKLVSCHCKPCTPHSNKQHKKYIYIRIVEDSVGKLVADAILDAKTANKSIKTGVCGEHGADPKSVDFFAKNKVDYVSCPAYRVPIAKLAAARAFLVTTAV